MAYHFTPSNGIGEIKCDTLEELKALVQLEPGRAFKSSKLRRADRVPGKSPGRGPARAWALAQWHGVHIDEVPQNVRTILRKLKNESPREYLTLTEKFNAFATWYAGKNNIDTDDIEVIAESLRELYKDSPEDYKKIVAEYDKKPASKK